MYKIIVDKTRKLIKLEAKGFIQLAEATAIHKEFESILKQFRKKEVLLMVNVSELKASAPEVVPLIKDIQTMGVEYSRKFASVQAKGVANMQLKRLGEQTNANSVIRRFETEEEAMKYLLDK